MNMKLNIAGLAAAVLMATGSVASAATFNGTFWDVDINGSNAIPGSTTQTPGNPDNNIVDNLVDALAIIDFRPGNATFDSTFIDYPQGGGANSTSNGVSLSTFLGTDASSLNGPVGIGDTVMRGSVFEFTGVVNFLAGVNSFSVASDDGFLLEIGGAEVARFDGTRAIGSPSTFDYDAGAGGNKAVRFVFFEDQNVQVGVQVTLNGDLMAPVPLPAAAWMLIAGLGGLFGLRRFQKPASAA